MTNMNDREPEESLGTSRLNHRFLKIFPHDFILKFQE